MHSYAHHHPQAETPESTAGTHGHVMNWGWRYDLAAWFSDTFLLRGTLRELRDTALDLARLRDGEAVLDVGCGTGTLALAAKERVGDTGRVVGVDPGPRQIARARSKAARRRLGIDLRVGVIERLALPDQSFDAALSTFMMHHLPDDLKRRGLSEIARTLKPGGRLVVVDFKRPERRTGRPARFGAGESGIQDLPGLMEQAGFADLETGEMRLPRLPGLAGAGFALGRKGSDASSSPSGPTPATSPATGR
jgi:ubiquinone/menaquinone biosynthesis C-methylase UbiE